MFKNYIKVAFRNLWKNKAYNLINILGMALGFAAFLLILMYVNYERSYDEIFPNHQQVIQAAIGDGRIRGSVMSAGFGPQAAQNFPEIKTYTRINSFVEKNLWSANNKRTYVNHLYSVDSTFFSVFQYPFLYGDPEHALDQPNSIVISEAISKQFFGDKDPIGQRITVNKKADITVTGVFKTPEGPTTAQANGFFKLNTHGREKQLFPMNYYTFFLLQEQANVPLLQHKLTAFLRQWASTINPKAGFDQANITLDPITEMHFSDMSGSGAGKPALLNMLLLIGAILLLIASVNFINLSVAAAMGRAKEVGLRKVLGSGKNSIKLQFYFEIFLQVFAAFVLASLLVGLLRPAYAHFLGLDSLKNTAGTWSMILYSGLTLLLVTLIAGAYPAFYLSHFVPSKVLKVHFVHGKSGTHTQRMMLVIQITLTTIFLVGILVMAKQVNYLKNIRLGLQPDQVLTIPIHSSDAYARYESVKTALLNVPGVTAVSRVSNLPGQGFGGNDYQYKSVKKEFSFLSVDYDFIRTMGMELISGRRFDAKRDPDTLGHIILNQAAVKALGITGDPVGQAVGWRTIIGLVKNFHYSNVTDEVQPLVLQLHHGNRMQHVLIRMRPDNVEPTLSAIKTAWTRYEPGFPITATFLDHYFDQFLRSFQRQEKIVSLFALLAVLLSLFGLFAFVAFSIRRRTKELAVRKVLGASNGMLLQLINKHFLWLIVLGNLLGWPLAYLASRQWLNGFAYRISIPLWPFVLVAVLSVALTAITISLQAWRAAKANPVQSLKYE